MNRIIMLVVTALFAFALTACGGDNTPKAGDNATTEQAAPADSTATDAVENKADTTAPAAADTTAPAAPADSTAPAEKPAE